MRYRIQMDGNGKFKIECAKFIRWFPFVATNGYGHQLERGNHMTDAAWVDRLVTQGAWAFCTGRHPFLFDDVGMAARVLHELRQKAAAERRSRQWVTIVTEKQA